MADVYPDVKHKTKKYVNWPENIKVESTLFYPHNDKDIITIVKYAQSHNQKVRVVGSRHSTSPATVNMDEQILLITLKKYTAKITRPIHNGAITNTYSNESTSSEDSMDRYGETNNIWIDHANMTVTVNAGWRLGQLYDELNKYNYFLETQTASPAFTIGGVISLPVHGARLGASILADSIVGMTLIDGNGKRVEKTQDDSDLDIYKQSLGLLGIITTVTFRIHQMNNVKTTFSTQHIFDSKREKIDRNIADPFFSQIVRRCLSQNEDEKAEYVHCFIDFHNDALLTLRSVKEDEKPCFRIDSQEADSVSKLPTEFYHKYIFSSYRKHKFYLKILGKIYRTAIQASMWRNTLDDKDMFWVDLGLRVYFMAYYIPIYTQDENKDEKNPDLSRMYEALEVIMTQVKAAESFNIDYPVDIRFVTSSSCPLSPLYSSQKTVYMVIDLITGPANLKLTQSKIKKKRLNRNFREFFTRVEQKWRELGGIPHYGKLFGFGGSDQDPFSPGYTRNIFSKEAKAILNKRAYNIFRNKFTNLLLE